MTRRTARRVRAIDQPIEDLASHASREVTVAVLAEYEDCDERTIIRMIAAGVITGCYKVGREWRIPTRAACVAFKVERRQAS